MKDTITLSKVQELCSSRKLNLTASRASIMSVLIKCKGPKTAYEILDYVNRTDSSAKPATIYRALDFLCTNDFAHRIETDNTYIACNGEESPHLAQFFICLKCKKAIEFYSHKATIEISKRAKEDDFKITEKIIEAKGFCQNCL